MGDVLGEAEGQLLIQRRETWNVLYNFDLRSHLTPAHVVDHSWAIRLSLNGNPALTQHFLSLAPGFTAILFKFQRLIIVISYLTVSRVHVLKANCQITGPCNSRYTKPHMATFEHKVWMKDPDVFDAPGETLFRSLRAVVSAVEWICSISTWCSRGRWWL